MPSVSAPQNSESSASLSTVIHTSPSITRQVLSLALPALGSLVAEPIFVFADSAMVGYLGTAPLAGLSIASTVVQTVVYLFVFLLFSTTTRAAQAYGRRDIPGALTTGIQSAYLALIIGTFLAAFLFFGAPWIISFFEDSPEALPHAHAYLRTSSPGVVGMFVVMAATGTLRGMHDTRAALIISAAGAALNIVLNALFIYGFGWGIAGSGVGTSITQLLMGGALVCSMGIRARSLYTLFVGAEASTPSLRSQVSLRPSFDGVRASARDGVWLLVRTVALRISLLAPLFVTTQLGVTALAAHHVAWTVWGFAVFALDALAIAGQTLFASTQAHNDAMSDAAAGKASSSYSQAKLLQVLTRWGLWADAVLGAVLVVLIPFVPHAFSEDPVVISAARLPLLIAAALMPVTSIVFLYDGIMMGADRARYLALCGMALLLVHLPVAWAVSLLAQTLSAQTVLNLVWLEYVCVFLCGRAAYLWLGSRNLRS